MKIVRAEKENLREILALQYLAYQSEAELVGTRDIQPLKQTLTEMEEEFQQGIFLKAVDEDGCIVGSVRGLLRDGTLHIGKLIVHPKRRGEGLGSRLLLEMERQYPGVPCELFTSSFSLQNLGMYKRRGYVEVRREEAGPGMEIIYLQKKFVRTC